MNRFEALSRRSFLRGTGALLALPFLEAMLPANARASAQAGVAGPPLRFVIVTVTGGTVLESWLPKETGPLPTKLSSILRPLEPLRSELLLLSGLSHTGKVEGDLNAHEAAAISHLTGAPVVKKERGRKIAGISVDQAAAQLIGRDTLLPSLELGTVPEAPLSFRGPESPVPSERNPRLVYERLFRGRKPLAPDWRRHGLTAPVTVGKSDSLDQSVLDLVSEDARALQKRLGRSDQGRLDEYLTSVRAVETRLARMEARLLQEARDGGTPIPLPDNLPVDTAAASRLLDGIGGDPEKHEEYIRLMSDLMVLALQTDSTRVATLALGSDEAMFPGVVTVGYEFHCHTLEHQGNAGNIDEADPISREALRQIHAWYTGSFARTLTRMKQIDEGGTSLLDNSMVLYTSYMADGGHGRSNYPVLLAGRAGGKLNPGRHLSFQSDTPMSNLYVEILERLGGKETTFGDSQVSEKAAYSGHLPGLV